MIALDVESLNSETAGDKTLTEMRFSVNKHFTNV